MGKNEVFKVVTNDIHSKSGKRAKSPKIYYKKKPITNKKRNECFIDLLHDCIEKWVKPGKMVHT